MKKNLGGRPTMFPGSKVQVSARITKKASAIVTRHARHLKVTYSQAIEWLIRKADAGLTVSLILLLLIPVSAAAQHGKGGHKQPKTCQDPTATNYGGPLPCTYPPPPPPTTTCTDTTAKNYGLALPCLYADFALSGPSLPISGTALWDPDPLTDNVRYYTVYEDGVALANTALSDQAVSFTTVGVHTVSVDATNDVGTSSKSTITVAVFIQ